MDKPSANQILRKIIREELTSIIRQELPKLLKESLSKQSVNQPQRIKESNKSEFPLTLNSSPMIRKEDIKFKKSSNPLTNLLNETAVSMLEERNSLNFTTDDVMYGTNPSLAFQPKEASVGSIDTMLATARPSSNIEAVQINTVPDYSALMDKMGI